VTLAASIALAALNPTPAFAAPPLRRPPVAFVPLDDRPVTLQLPVMLGAVAGQPLVTPPLTTIGHYLQPGNPEAILNWLESPATADASAIVVSTDMVAYGGLVASRTPQTGMDPAVGRLRRLARLKLLRPGAFVGAFGTIVRLAPTGVPGNGQVPGYWATGTTVDAIAAFANLPDPPAAPGDAAKAARLRALIGQGVLDAYLGVRARNLGVDEWALQFVYDGGIDRLVIGQDDAGPTGLHLRDVAALGAAVRDYGIGDRVSIEPGADELGMVAVARAFARNVGWQPAVRVVYSRPGGGEVQDRLEYVPIDVTIGRLIAACGARRVAQGGDVVLYVRVPDTNDADEIAFENALATDVAAERSVTVADLSFLSGGPGESQRLLTEDLIARGIAGKIDGFASWNTTANTVGTSLAAALAAGAGRRAGTFNARAQAEFLLDRYIDDYAFHQFVRPELNETLRARDMDTTLLTPGIAREASSLNRALLWPRALALLAQIFPHYRDTGLTITLPWDRTFETAIEVRLQSR
jgi:Protein of unknown function (DUF4127)